MNKILERYVSEIDHGFGNSVEITQILCSVKSRYQRIEIYQTAELGKLLMLDGVIQLTEFDDREDSGG